MLITRIMNGYLVDYHSDTREWRQRLVQHCDSWETVLEFLRTKGSSIC